MGCSKEIESNQAAPGLSPGYQQIKNVFVLEASQSQPDASSSIPSGTASGPVYLLNAAAAADHARSVCPTLSSRMVAVNKEPLSKGN